MPSFDLAAAKDFVPVSQLARFEFRVFVGTAVPAEVKDFKQFRRWLKANPDQAMFGVPATAPFQQIDRVRLVERPHLQEKLSQGVSVPGTPYHVSCLNYRMI